MTDETQTPESTTPELTRPKKRGRPSNADLAARLGQPAGSSTAKPVESAKPLGAKRGPKPGRKRKGMSDDEKSALAKQVMGLHAIAAAATGVPELAISDTEASMLASAIATMSAEYGLSLSGKTGALLQLLGVSAMIYFPRLGAIKQRAIAKKAAKQNLHVVDNTNAPANT